MTTQVNIATSADFDQAVESKGNQLVVAYFWGHQCPNCEIFASHLPRILQELQNDPVRFVKVNAYEEVELGKRFGLYGIPTFVLFRNGKMLGRMTSFQSFEYFITVIREQLAKPLV